MGGSEALLQARQKALLACAARSEAMVGKMIAGMVNGVVPALGIERALWSTNLSKR